MPLVYRSMLADESGRPLSGEGRDRLGVRLPPRPTTDVDIDSSGCVALNHKGMSVFRHWRDFPPFLLSALFDDGVTAGDRPKSMRLWRHGDGPFLTAPLNAELQVEVDTASHGVVSPRTPLTPPQYLEALAKTQDEWSLVESRVEP